VLGDCLLYGRVVDTVIVTRCSLQCGSNPYFFKNDLSLFKK